MYYCLVREEPNPAIVSIHTTLDEAENEKELLLYEESFKEHLNILNSYVNSSCRPYTSSIFAIIQCDGGSSKLSFDERKKNITENYTPLIQKAQIEYDIKYNENKLKVILQNERQSQEQRKEIEAFMLKWETCDSDIRTIWIDKIKPIVRSYLLKKNDTEIREWMRDRFIV